MARRSNFLPDPFRLITFPVSHYCEKARWALARLNIPYTEERHAPLFHRLATNSVGAKSVPVLVAGVQVLKDSTDILKYLDTIACEDDRLYPSTPELLQKVEMLEGLFNYRLGPAARIWAYSFTLNTPKLAKRRFTFEVPFYERVLFPIVFPVVSSIIRRQFNITSKVVNDAHTQITQIFEYVGDLLADGRTYLVGDRFSAADLTFASLSTPVVRPLGYGDDYLDLSNLDQLPLKMAQEVRVFRGTSAGIFALQLWNNYTASKLKYKELPKCDSLMTERFISNKLFS
jgi:glutathione S-transferase